MSSTYPLSKVRQSLDRLSQDLERRRYWGKHDPVLFTACETLAHSLRAITDQMPDIPDPLSPAGYRDQYSWMSRDAPGIKHPRKVSARQSRKDDARIH